MLGPHTCLVFQFSTWNYCVFIAEEIPFLKPILLIRPSSKDVLVLWQWKLLWFKEKIRNKLPFISQKTLEFCHLNRLLQPALEFKKSILTKNQFSKLPSATWERLSGGYIFLIWLYVLSESIQSCAFGGQVGFGFTHDLMCKSTGQIDNTSMWPNYF